MPSLLSCVVCCRCLLLVCVLVRCLVCGLTYVWCCAVLRCVVCCWCGVCCWCCCSFVVVAAGYCLLCVGVVGVLVIRGLFLLLVSCLTNIGRCLSYVVCCGIVAMCCALLVLVFVVRCVLAGCCWFFFREVLFVGVAFVAAVWLSPVDCCWLLLRVV